MIKFYKIKLKNEKQIVESKLYDKQINAKQIIHDFFFFLFWDLYIHENWKHIMLGTHSWKLLVKKRYISVLVHCLGKLCFTSCKKPIAQPQQSQATTHARSRKYEPNWELEIIDSHDHTVEITLSISFWVLQTRTRP